MRVLLIHGLGRTPLSLLGLARDLKRAGHQPRMCAYVGALESYRAIAARIRRRLQAAAATEEPYAAIGHSHTRVFELPASHTFMMNNQQVRTLVRKVLGQAAP